MSAAPQEPDAALLQVRQVHKRYGPVHALRGAQLRVEPGEVVALLGVNGAGKTTLLRCVCGLLEPDEGQVGWGGGGDPRCEVGYCPQALTLWPALTCLEQLAFLGQLHGLGRRARRARARELLEALGLQGRADDLARTLSGGMKRRLSIALALVHDPALLVLDEAEVGLDPQSRVALRAFLASLAHRQGKGVLLSTHGLDEVERLADRVVILDQGQVLAEGAPAQLVAELGQASILELELDPEAPGRGELLEELARHAELEHQGARVRARIQAPMEQLERLLASARDRGLKPRHLSVRQPGLEDVFLELTGRRLAS